MQNLTIMQTAPKQCQSKKTNNLYLALGGLVRVCAYKSVVTPWTHLYSNHLQHLLYLSLGTIVLFKKIFIVQ